MRISDWSSDVCSSDLPHRSGQRADHSCHRRLPQGSRLEAGEARRGLLVLRRKPRRQDLQRVATAMSLDDRTRTWQLVMTGDDLRHVTLETQPDMARLPDLYPSISHLTLDHGADRVTAARLEERRTGNKSVRSGRTEGA